ncbi:hypothetical protein [Siminovitchia sp. FSL W7-1587]|uniref:hypothetical protein n=1 Tax=Siminovitchia sp. FSL W7-1587 TaxID=2954699 RepID=UPI0030D18254
MTLKGASVIGGQINYPSLTNKLPSEEYAKAKVHIWLMMLNDGQNPVRWLKPNGKGTKVNFETLKDQSDYDEKLLLLQEYINQVNEDYGLDFKLKRT